GDLNLVEIDADVQKHRAGQRGAVQRQRVVSTASQYRRIDFFVGERATRQMRITPQVRFQKIDAAAMHRHRWRVGKSNTALGYQIETTMLALRAAAIGLKS